MKKKDNLHKRQHNKKGAFFIVSGPSGSGKTTILKDVLLRFKDIKYSISYTTRKPRPGEEDGVDYKFVTMEKFKEMIDNDRFAEWAEVYGNYYGTPVEEIENSVSLGMDLILEIDEQGAKSIKKRYGKGIYIFIAPPSGETQSERLSTRIPGRDDDLNDRLESYVREMENQNSYDYIIINDILNDAVEKFVEIILLNREKSLTSNNL